MASNDLLIYCRCADAPTVHTGNRTGYTCRGCRNFLSAFQLLLIWADEGYEQPTLMPPEHAMVDREAWKRALWQPPRRKSLWS